MKNHVESDDQFHVDDLTWREQDILNLLAQRLTNREIAQRLHLAESTVKDYVGKILSKLYVKNRRQAVERAKALGLLEADRETVVTPTSNLPAEPTPFIGRADELAEIKEHLLESRLLTLTGPGGIGKTRLALKTAAELADEFDHGSFFVSLAPIRSVDHIVQTIAEAVKFPIATHENPQHQLLRYLQKRQLLLVMDNFEHLMDGVGIVHEILQVAPGVKILTTSRERLNLHSEMVLNVGGMAFPEQAGSKDSLNYDSIHLFVQSARKVRPEFDPSSEELKQIIKICQIVEGMPLAIELAAAWLHILNVDEVIEEIEKGLDILTTELRDAPERHRSIRAVFDHSWSLLDGAEQKIFELLSVFRGGFTREAAQQVSGASLPLLAGLVSKSLLSHDPDSGRLEIHELLQHYVQERLQDTPETIVTAQEAHAAYYAVFMQERWQDLKGHRQMQALAEIEADIENVRAAWRYCVQQRNASQIWMYIHGLWYFHWIRWWNHPGMELFAEAARILQGQEDEELIALQTSSTVYQSFFMAWLGLSDQGYELAQNSVAILKQGHDPRALIMAYYSLALNAFFLNRYAEQYQTIHEMLRIANETSDKWQITFVLFAVSMYTLIREDFSEARRHAQYNLDLNEELGDVIGSTLPLLVLGYAAYAEGEYEEARGYYLRCLKISEKAGFHYAIQTSTKYLCKTTLSMGRIVEAEDYLIRSLTIAKEIGFVRDIVNLLYELARLRVAQGKPEQAVELLVLVLQHPASQQVRLLEGRIGDSAEALLAKLEGEVPQEVYSKALERGQASDMDRVVNDFIGPQN